MKTNLRQVAEKDDFPVLCTRAAIIPSSIDVAARTVRVQYTTGARVERYEWTDYDSYRKFMEELSTEKGHVRLDRFKAGAVPVLDSHRNWGLDSVIGKVIDADETHATIRFSGRKELEGIWQDIVDGVISNISVGYRVYKYEDITKEDDKVRILRAIDWEPLEVSFVAIPADPNAGVRSHTQTTNRCVIVDAREQSNQDEETMKNKNQPTKVRSEDEGKNPAADENENKNPAGAENEGDDANDEGTEGEGSEGTGDEGGEGERGDQSEAQKRGMIAERKRATDIRTMVRSLDLDESLADDYIQKGVTVEQARAAVIEKMAKKDESTETRSNIQGGQRDEIQTRNEAIENYLLHRAFPTSYKMEGAAKDFRGMSLMDIAREIVGHKECRGLNRDEIIARAFHSTSDFGNILMNVASKSLRRGYADTKRTFLPIARRITVPDFRERNLVSMSNAPSLEKVLEGGEYKYGTLSDTGEKFRLSTYGKIIAITRQLIINDDLDALTRTPQKMAAAAARLENRMVWDLLTSNPTMEDGVALFHADHGNLTNATLASGNAIGTMRKLMRLQKDPSGEDFLNYDMKHLMVPAELEEVALKGKALIVPNQISQAQVYASTYDIISEPQLDANSTVNIYGAADPSEADGLVYGYLEGEEGPYLETRNAFTRDGVEFKVRHDFGVGVEDYRGLVKSTNNAS